MTVVYAKARSKNRPASLYSTVFRPEPPPAAEPPPARPAPPDAPACPEWRDDPWPLDEDDFDLPDPPLPSPASGAGAEGFPPADRHIGTVTTEYSRVAGPLDLDVTAERHGERPAIWVGPLRFDRVQALRLCNFLLRALRENDPWRQP